jgi:hypothetical protein
MAESPTSFFGYTAEYTDTQTSNDLRLKWPQSLIMEGGPGIMWRFKNQTPPGTALILAYSYDNGMTWTDVHVFTTTP